MRTAGRQEDVQLIHFTLYNDGVNVGARRQRQWPAGTQRSACGAASPPAIQLGSTFGLREMAPVSISGTPLCHCTLLNVYIVHSMYSDGSVALQRINFT